VKYVEVMQHCIKLYEYKGNELPDLDKFNMDLRELQGWRLRTLNSQQKVLSIIRKLKSNNFGKDDALTDPLVEDFEVINNSIQSAGARLENMLPVVTSLVQIIDARQSFAETANISRLTVLALVFVPLTFVSSLFSMNTENLPGRSHFWVYFVVAIPVTILVFLVARPPTAMTKRASGWLQSLKRRRKVPERLRNEKDRVREIPEA
jgi:Mg2+ and Co2+ transporter CorA